MGFVVADVSCYSGNSCDNLGDSLRSGCDNNGYPGLAALVIAYVEEDDDSWLGRIEKLDSQSAGIGLFRTRCCLCCWQSLGVLTGNSFNYIVSTRIERRNREWKRHGNRQLQAF
jgi:hypothetical protein